MGFGIDDDLKYYEIELDSNDNNGSQRPLVAATDWPIFRLGGASPLQKVAAIKILEAEIPFSWYVFNSSNNTFLLYEEGDYVTVSTVTLPVGNYTAAQIATNLQTALNAVTMNALTYTVTYNAATQKFTFINTGAAPFAFSFGDQSDSGNTNPRLFIGFPGGFSYSTVQTLVAPNAALISGPNYVYVNSLKLGHSCELYLPQGANNLEGGKAGPQMARIPVNVQSGGIINWADPDPSKWFDLENLSKIDQFDFYLTLGNTSTQTPLQLNGLSFSLKLGVLIKHSSSLENDNDNRGIKRIRLI